MLIKTIVRQLIPIAKPYIENGSIEVFIDELKVNSLKNKGIDLTENQTAEIIITNEKDKKNHVSIIVLEDMQIKQIIESMPLSDLILKLLNSL